MTRSGTGRPPRSLDRFVRAQEGAYPDALAELRSGRKSSHWIWFVLPQLRGLGSSGMAERYGLDGPGEARAYLAHPVLGARLREIVGVVHEQACRRGVKLPSLMGSRIDALKLVSCLTLFAPLARAASATNADGALAAFASQADEILDAAAAQGFPRCAVTTARLREEPPAAT